MKISFMGDIMPGGKLIYKEKDSFSKELLEHLNKADLRVATLESAIGDDMEFDSEKMKEDRCIIFSPNKSISILKKLNINIVSLANNHVFDLGKEGLINTIKSLELNGIKFVGAGRNELEAKNPLVIENNGVRIALIAFIPKSWKPLHEACGDEPGLNVYDKERIENDITELKKTCDKVFVLPHIGVEFTYWPCPGDVDIINDLINIGADGVFCSHTHQIQPVVSYKNVIISYGLGNFLFPDYYAMSDNPICYPVNNKRYKKYYYYNSHKSEAIWERKWKDKNRVGCVITLDIINNNNSVQYVKLSSDILLECVRIKKCVDIKLKLIGFILSYKYYLYIYIVLKKMRVI